MVGTFWLCVAQGGWRSHVRLRTFRQPIELELHPDPTIHLPKPSFKPSSELIAYLGASALSYRDQAGRLLLNDLAAGKVDQEMMKLAAKLIGRKVARFGPERYSDSCVVPLKELAERKAKAARSASTRASSRRR